MGKKILLVTAQPLSTTDAENLVKDFGAADTEFVIAVPAKVVDTGSPSLLSGNTANPGTDGTQIGTVRDNLPGAQGGLAGDPGRVNYGERGAVEAEAIAGSASAALFAAGASANGHSLPEHDLAAHLSDAAIANDVDEVVVMVGLSGLGRVFGADLTSRIERHLKASGSKIPAVREHRHS